MQKICYKEIEIIFQNNDEKKVVFIYKEKQIVVKLSKSRGFANGRTIVADLLAYFVYIECCFDELENRIKIAGVRNAIEIVAAFREEQPQFDRFVKSFTRADCEEFIGDMAAIVSLDRETFEKLLETDSPQIEVGVSETLNE